MLGRRIEAPTQVVSPGRGGGADRLCEPAAPAGSTPEAEARGLLNTAVRLDSGTPDLESFIADTNGFGSVRSVDWQRVVRGSIRLEGLARLIAQLAERNLDGDT
jgi:hypothetical protein